MKIKLAKLKNGNEIPVREDGQVYKDRPNYWHMRRTWTPGGDHSGGYKSVWPQNVCHLVHRLVACAFLGLDVNDLDTIVHHKDHDRSNNNLDNLELMSQAEHMSLHIKSYHHDLRDSKRK